MELLLIFIIAISLSMDAFSLSISYGTLNLSLEKERKLSILVGLFHFFMPILGYNLGIIILNIIKIDPSIIAGIVFIVLGIEMLISVVKKEEIKNITNLFSMLLFSFSVSIDSFSIGIGITGISNNILLCSLVFSIVSSIITYIGLRLGKRLSLSIGYLSNIIGSMILIILGLFYIK